MGTMGEDGIEGINTLRGRGYPSIRQFSVFSPNRTGQLLTLVRRIETAQLRVCALTISDSAECAVIRLVINDPERGYEVLSQGGYGFCEVDLLGVQLPDNDQPVLSICTALLQAEINIHYCLPLLTSMVGPPAIAFYVDAHEMAANLLEQQGFTLLREHDLE